MHPPDDLGGRGNRPDQGIVCPGDDDKTTNQQLIAKRAAKSAKVQTKQEKSRKSRQHTIGTRWSDHEDATLLSFAGEKTARELAKLLGRTERSVYCRLARLSLSSTLKDGYTPRLLAEDLHVDRGKVRQWLLDGKLESQGLHVTRNSIKKLCEKGNTEIVWKGKVLAVLGRSPQRVLETLCRCERKSKRNQQIPRGPRRISQSYTFGRAGRILQISKEVVKKLVAAGLLKLNRLRIEEDALNKFAREHPSEINWGLVDAELLQWLGVSRLDDETTAEKLPWHVKHLFQVRTCPGCHRSCRGNGYSIHIKFCPDTRGLEPEVLEWAADHPTITVSSKLAGFRSRDVKIQVGHTSSSSEGSTT